jgi:hypothetical protein
MRKVQLSYISPCANQGKTKNLTLRLSELFDHCREKVLNSTTVNNVGSVFRVDGF